MSGECFVHVNRQRLCACACHARTPAVLCSCQAGACRCIDHQAFACLCMRGRGRKLVAIQTETHACQEQSLAVCRAGSVSATPLAQPPKSECECSAAKRRWCRTFLAIVLASCSNMTRARSAAVVPRGGSRPGVGLRTACLGLDCHEFSSKPSHTHAWSTRFLPGHMFPVKAQTITAVARVLKRCERARLRLEAPSATRCVPRGGWAWRWAQTQRCGADPRSFSPASAAAFLRARITSLPSRWRGVQ